MIEIYTCDLFAFNPTFQNETSIHFLSYRKGETPNVIYHNPIKNKFYNYKIYDGGLESPTVLML